MELQAVGALGRRRVRRHMFRSADYRRDVELVPDVV
jgi:hypothetical protein